MSMHPQHRDGASEEPQGSPNVYLPQAVPAPAYEEYTDPAAAHGWQNAYDATAELSSVPHDDTAPLPVAEPAGPGRAAERRARRQAPARSRRIAVTAGAVGVVSLAAVIAGFALPGSSSDAPQGKGKGADSGTSAEVSAEPTAPESSGATSAPGSSTGGLPAPTAPASTASGGSASATATTAKEDRSSGASGAPSAAPSAAPTSAAPSATTTASVPAPSDSGFTTGRGRGNGRHPK
ncbi:hypothetical protein [Streptomyces sp. V3I7]|uniref:hypothetical protein n=1 Tax=Streptomyces sp. V3I7 TaxID=3042278 RepID=UPI002786E7D5|nr:hypothetical protein [Streptomyces sp. V3I7]MDQ0992779.1 hypothetical protein [Streptomyces sp. V3I7]